MALKVRVHLDWLDATLHEGRVVEAMAAQALRYYAVASGRALALIGGQMERPTASAALAA